MSLKPANGLSLCIQGTFLNLLSNSSKRRFIPVYTGNIHRYRYIHIPASVYPCVYREHTFYSFGCRVQRGLSLCIQGTYPYRMALQPHHRFIPVYTGNIPIITYCFIIKILTTKFLPIF